MKPTYDVYLNRGNAYTAQKRYDLAIADFNKVIELEPKKAKAYASRAAINEKDKKYDDAIKDYTKAIELDAENADYYKFRGKIYQAYKKNDESIADLTKAINLNPNDAKAFESRGMIFFKLKNYNNAIDDFSRAITLDSNVDDAYLYRANARLQKFLLDKVEYSSEESAADFKRGNANTIKNASREIEIDPNNLNAYLRRAFSYGGQENYDKAISDYRKVLEIDEKYVQAYFALSKIYDLLGNLQFAVDALTQAIAIEPNNGELYFYRGAFFYKMNNLEKSLADHRKGGEAAADDDPYKKINLSQVGSIERGIAADKKLKTQLEKNRKDQKRRENTQAILNGMQTITNAITQTPSTQTPTATQTNSSGGQTSGTNNSPGQTTGNSTNSSSSGRLPGSLVVNTSTDSEESFKDCSTDTLYKNMPQYKHCWGSWQQTGLSQIQFRVKGPVGRGYNAIDDQPNKVAYGWSAGFKNTSNAIVSFKSVFTMGDGQTVSYGATLAPGQYYIMNDAAFVTFSNSPNVIHKFSEYEICTNVSRTTSVGYPAWRCNEK